MRTYIIVRRIFTNIKLKCHQNSGAFAIVKKNRILVILSLVTLTLSVNKIVAQSPADSLKIYNPIENGDDVRRILTNFFSILGEENNALIKKYSTEAEFARKNRSFKDASAALLKSANIYFKAGIYNQALDLYFTALNNYQSEGDSINAAVVQIQIGRTYYFLDLPSSLDYIKIGAKTLEGSKDPELIAYASYANGTVEKDGSRARTYFQNALKIQLEVVKRKPNDYEAKSNLSRYYNTNGKTELALKVAEEIKDDWLTVLYLNNLGYTKVLEGHPKESLNYFFRSLDISLANRYKTLLRNTYDNITRAYRLMGEWEKSVFYFSFMHFVEESLFKEEFAAQASIARVKYESEKKELENAFLKKEQTISAENLEIEKNEKIIALIFALIVVFISFYIYYSRRKIRAAKFLLDQEHEETLLQKAKAEDLNIVLRASEENLIIAQATAKIANWEWDFKNDKFSFSAQFPLIYEVDPEILRTDFRETILNRIHHDDKAQYQNYFMGKPTDARNEEVEYRVVAGEKIKWIKAKRIARRNSYGEVDKIHGIVQDITESKEEEQIKIKIAAQQSFTKQLIDSQEEERKRIAGELHDGLGQDVLLIKNRAQLCLQNKELDTFTTDQITEISDSVSGILKLIRGISLDLRPAHLERIGLTKTIGSAILKVSELSSINITRSVGNIDSLLTAENEINFFRIIQEGLNNIIRHSEAANAKIEIVKVEENIEVKIIDDGKGFKLESGIETSGGFGLNNILHRVRILNGTLNVSSEVSKGTSLEIIIPVENNGK